MNPIKRIGYVFLSYALGAFMSQPLMALPTINWLDLAKNIELSGAGGWNWMNVGNSYFVISPYETDANFNNSVSHAPIWELGVGYSLLKDQLSSRDYFNALMIGLNVYRNSESVNGHVWQYDLAQFNNYSAHVPINNTRLMIDAKPQLMTWKMFSPYLVLGVGITWNTAAYYETVIGSGVDPASSFGLTNKTTAFAAYDLGAGLRIDITDRLTATAEYLYTYLGHAASSSTPNNTISLQTAPTFNIYGQAALFGLAWKF